MSAKPHNYSTMEPILGSSVCLICFEMIEKQIYIPSDAPEKLFMNCNKYLHSTLTKGTLKDIKLQNKNQVPLCKSCFDSALELTQLSEQLTTIEKDISDLNVAFSMAVFHRRSQVYNIGQSCTISSIVEFNEACLPPNLFSMKLGDQNTQPNKTNQEMDTNGLHLQTDISNVNVKCEGSDIQFDNLSGNPQQSIANGDAEIQFNKYNLDKQSGQSTIEKIQNLPPICAMRIVHVTGRKDSKKCRDPKNGMRLSMSDLLKSVKMPKIILERLKIVGHKLDVSVGNSNQTKRESHQKNLDEILKDDKFSVHSSAPKSSGDGKLLKCFYCEKTFAQECHRTTHHKTHNVDKMYERSLGKQKFVYRNNQNIRQITPTGIFLKKTIFKCSYCKKEFHTPAQLQNHERIHTREKSFKCSFCSNRFKSRSQLKIHERTRTGEKPFKCSFCNKGFNQRINLNSHERTHTGEKPFKCSFCNKGFNQRTHLKSHERTHTGEKPFKCSFCNKRFIQCTQLKRHERTHTGEKPFNNFHQKDNQEQLSTLISQVDNQKDGALVHLKHQVEMHSTGPMKKCSLCEMTCSHDEERGNHEEIHRREDEIVNENFIVGI